MEEIIKMGVHCAELHGICGAFFPRMFVSSTEGWRAEMEKLRNESDRIFDEVYPDAHNGGKCGPVGEIVIDIHDGYVYVYMIGYRGEMDSRMFTTENIAGEFTGVPPFGGYGSLARE